MVESYEKGKKETTRSALYGKVLPVVIKGEKWLKAGGQRQAIKGEERRNKRPGEEVKVLVKRS